MPSRQEVIGIVVALVVVGGAFSFANLFQPSPSMTADAVTTASGLMYQDLVVGTGELAEAGTLVSAHYTGSLDDGTVFDSSIPRGEPFIFPLGAGRVIKGWDEGIQGMKVGGKRNLTIPPNLGYGAQANDVIPANSTLHFEVELIEVKPAQ